MTDEPLQTALVAESIKRASLVWITVPGRSAIAVWQVTHDGVPHVVVAVDGDGQATEQHVPGLLGAGEVIVTARSKDTGGLLASFATTPEVIGPDAEGYDEAAAALQASRLNGADAATTLASWREHAHVVRLRPTGRLVEDALNPSTELQAVPPVATDATTAPKLPWVLGKRARKRALFSRD